MCNWLKPEMLNPKGIEGWLYSRRVMTILDRVGDGAGKKWVNLKVTMDKT